MIVRCGRCGVQFQVPGEGRYACPSCGAANEVRAVPGGGAPTPEPEGAPAAPGRTPGVGDVFGGDMPGAGPPGPPPEPSEPSPRRTCPSCGFTFIVGDIEVAACPNCGDEVSGSPDSS